MKKLLRTLLLAGLLCPSLLFAPGSTAHVQAGSTNWGNRYFEALKLYEEGRYALAAERFSLVADRAEDEFLKRRATIGTLAAGLAGADSREEYDTALDAWRKWTAAQGGGPLPVDAALLEPVFRRASRCSTDPEAGEMAQEVERLREQIQALENLYREIKRKEKIIE